MVKKPVGLLLLLLASCQTIQRREFSPVYDDPAASLGQEVRVCGYLSGGGNLWRDSPTRDLDDPIGLSLVDKKAVTARRTGYRCITGTVVRLGCQVEVICLEWNFEYGIEVRKID